MKNMHRNAMQLVEQLKLENIIFTGRVDIVKYMEKLDFTILTSISEGQPLSVLESFAARRPCVTTDVGCCQGTSGRKAKGMCMERQAIMWHLCIVTDWLLPWRKCVNPEARRASYGKKCDRNG